MSFFDPQFLDNLRDKLILSDVIGRFISTQKKGREFQALCPFHKEKTPSFTINDEKGFYHCFGCGAHGDALKFIQEHKGLPFPETVEFLASMAGVSIPQSSPEQKRVYEKKKTLYDVNDMACQWFEKSLQTPNGSTAKTYLLNRGFNEETIKKYRIGWANDSYESLRNHLSEHKVKIEEMEQLGLVITPDNREKKPYDRFRGRVMFPIIDLKGRVIAFGGRVLGDAQPKYMNSPETPLFNKSESLFNINFARDHAYTQEQFVVVEGYTDVIALSQAGIGNAVAPLGTALTTEQIQKMWRYVPTITLCFDGDSAGKRAALRAAERCMPLLNSDKNIKFLNLPNNQDPDDFIKSDGVDNFKKQVKKAKGLSDFLWTNFTDKQNFDTPEKQAKLQSDLEKSITPIQDDILISSYKSYFRQKIWDEIRKKNSTKKMVSSGKNSIENLQKRLEELIVVCLANHPFLLDELEEQVSQIDLTDGNLMKVLKTILQALHFQTDIDRDKLILYLKEADVFANIEPFFNETFYGKYKFIHPDADIEDVRNGWFILFNNLQKNRLTKEIKQVEQELARNMTQDNLARLIALRQEVDLISNQYDENL